MIKLHHNIIFQCYFSFSHNKRINVHVLYSTYTYHQLISLLTVAMPIICLLKHDPGSVLNQHLQCVILLSCWVIRVAYTQLSPNRSTGTSEIAAWGLKVAQFPICPLKLHWPQFKHQITTPNSWSQHRSKSSPILRFCHGISNTVCDIHRITSLRQYLLSQSTRWLSLSSNGRLLLALGFLLFNLSSPLAPWPRTMNASSTVKLFLDNKTNQHNRVKLIWSPP